MATTKKCYFPYGNLIDSEQENVFPCDPTSEGHGACCPADAVCLSNGLCFQQNSWGNRVARSGCTDQMWEDGSCAGICEDVFPTIPISIYLSEPDSVNGNFCCGGMYNGTSCPHATKGSYEPFTMEKGMVLFPNTSMTLSQYALLQTTTENSTTSSANVESLSNTAVVNTNTTGIGPGGGAATTTATDLTTSASSTNSNNAAVQSTTTPLIALGISLGIALLILSGLLIWQWRRARKLRNQLTLLKQQQQIFPPQSQDQGSMTAATGWSDRHAYSTMGWSAGETTPFARSEILGEEVGRVKELPGGERRGELQG